jgi:O-antigen ligase
LRNVVDRLQYFPIGKDIVDLLFLAMLVGWLLSSLGQGEKLFARSRLNGILFLMIGYTFISVLQGSSYLKEATLFNVSMDRVQDWKNFCLLPMLFFLTFNNIRDRRWIWRTVVLMGLVMVIMDYYLLQQLSWYTEIVSRDKIRGTFVFLGPNEIAAFYTQYTFLLLCLFFSMRRSRLKYALLALIGANLFCILFLFSRGAYLATAVGLFFTFLIKRKRWLIPLLLILFFWNTALPEKVRTRIEMTHNEYGQLDASAEMRLVVWEHSLDLIQRNPLTGVGYGVFRYLGLELGDTHNIYLKILVEQGIIGFLIFLILIFKLFWEGIILYRKDEDPLAKGLGLGLSMCVLALLVNNFFGDRWTYMEVSSNLWVFAALVARLNLTREEAPETTTNEKKIGLRNSR